MENENTFITASRGENSQIDVCIKKNTMRAWNLQNNDNAFKYTNYYKLWGQANRGRCK